MSAALRIRAVLAAAVFVAGFVAVRPSLADPPLRESSSFDVTFDSRNWTRRCGFPVSVRQAGKVTQTVYAANGIVRKEIDTADGLKTTYFSATGSFTAISSATLHTSYPEGTAIGAPAVLVFTGNQLLLPGLPQAGRDAYVGEVAVVTPEGIPVVDIIAPTSTSGHFSSFPDEVAALCRALA